MLCCKDLFLLPNIDNREVHLPTLKCFEHSSLITKCNALGPSNRSYLIGNKALIRCLLTLMRSVNNTILNTCMLDYCVIKKLKS